MGDYTRDIKEVINTPVLLYVVLRNDDSKATPIECDDQGNIYVDSSGA